MAQYTASTSDKLKSVALHKFWISGFGMLGLHYFYAVTAKAFCTLCFLSFI